MTKRIDPGMATGRLTIKFPGSRVVWEGEGKTYFSASRPSDWIIGQEEIVLKDDLGNEFYETCHEHELWLLIEELLAGYKHGYYILTGELDIEFIGAPIHNVDEDYWYLEDVDWNVSRHFQVEPTDSKYDDDVREIIEAVIKCGEADNLEEAEQFCKNYEVDIVTEDYYGDLYDDMARELIHSTNREEARDTLDAWLSYDGVKKALVKHWMEEEDLTEIPGLVGEYMRVL